jgi:hypothetical protein
MLSSAADTLHGSRTAVRDLFPRFKQKWQHEEGVVRYFEKEWEGNIGMLLLSEPAC